MGRRIAALDHLHPGMAVVDQSDRECLPCCVLRAEDVRCAAGFEKILERVPGKLVGALKRLNQSLLFQVGKVALLCERCRA